MIDPSKARIAMNQMAREMRTVAEELPKPSRADRIFGVWDETLDEFVKLADALDEFNYPDPNQPGVGGAEQLMFMQIKRQACGVGNHAWTPWLPIRDDDGHVLRYVTFCSNCKHEEQYDL